MKSSHRLWSVLVLIIPSFKSFVHYLLIIMAAERCTRSARAQRLANLLQTPTERQLRRELHEAQTLNAAYKAQVSLSFIHFYLLANDFFIIEPNSSAWPRALPGDEPQGS
jgi:hypothetical protein